MIYKSHGVDENGSPKDLTITKRCRAKEASQFGLNYYRTGNVKQRIMQKSKNIVVPAYLTNAIKDEKGNVYELFYLEWQGSTYRIYENLKYFKSNLYRILDCQELN